HDEYLLEEDLRLAIGTSQIKLNYQPITEAFKNNHIISVETLVRWQHPQAGYLSPGDFLALAEDSQLIVELDYSILHGATRAMAGWLDRRSNLIVSINVSAITLSHPDLIDTLKQVLEQSGLPASQLCLEVTETAIMQNRTQAVETIHQIKALGISIALDDFGTGYSSMAYLKDLDADVLKIDGTFTRGIGVDRRDERTIETMIELGHDLGMEIVVEGVETRAQYDWLAQHNVDRLQGFYL